MIRKKRNERRSLYALVKRKHLKPTPNQMNSTLMKSMAKREKRKCLSFLKQNLTNWKNLNSRLQLKKWEISKEMTSS